MNALANMAWNETMPPPMIEERTLLDFDIVQDFIYQKNGIKKPLESVRGSLVRRLLEYSPTRTDHNGLNENLLFLSAVSDECFFTFVYQANGLIRQNKDTIWFFISQFIFQVFQSAPQMQSATCIGCPSMNSHAPQMQFVAASMA